MNAQAQQNKQHRQSKQGKQGAATCFAVIAGPCAVESHEQLTEVATLLNKHHLHFLRGGAWKPRSNPYTFQGMGLEGLRILSEVADTHELKVITELTDVDYLDEVVKAASFVQVGTRNMANYALLKKLGKAAGAAGKPVLFKRGMAATVEEWLQAAEYLTSQGACVIYCERGIRGFDPSMRFTLDLMAVPLVKQLAAAPVVVDVSHSTGRADLVIPAARAALAAGADGIMVEVHPDPAHAKSDGAQSLDLPQFEALMDALTPLAAVMGRALC
ncbi:MAG: bifunctional 3-deoxy-7-phosphoheptulonate synthase/chorismate mutase [Actinomycetes bacterium]|jgi:3-deoxy-7-phosphoheptulonate synthase|nr:bifunctional 3-deoxy-7-phosphoheptulonate synthase/chorismate mutase [Actinomycetes bacterium]